MNKSKKNQNKMEDSGTHEFASVCENEAFPPVHLYLQIL